MKYDILFNPTDGANATSEAIVLLKKAKESFRKRSEGFMVDAKLRTSTFPIGQTHLEIGGDGRASADSTVGFLLGFGIKDFGIIFKRSLIQTLYK